MFGILLSIKGGLGGSQKIHMLAEFLRAVFVVDTSWSGLKQSPGRSRLVDITARAFYTSRRQRQASIGSVF